MFTLYGAVVGACRPVRRVGSDIRATINAAAVKSIQYLVVRDGDV